MTFRVLVTARSFAHTPGAHHDFLKEHDCVVDLRPPAHPYSAAELSQLIPGYQGVILGLDACDASVIERADRLRVISRYGVGVDAVDLTAAAGKDIAVTNTPGANQNGVAELAIALLFALARHIPQVASAARHEIWQRGQGWEVAGKTLGLIGFGAIGRQVAQKAAGLGMNIIAYDPFWQGDSSLAQRVNLPELLATADVISLHTALTPDTARLINAETLAQMKTGAYLINTARGELVDENALLHALQSGRLAGAAADVFEHDPPSGSPLLALQNFIATPHIGATTRESVERMAMMAAQNLVAILEGQPCPFIVNSAR